MPPAGTNEDYRTEIQMFSNLDLDLVLVSSSQHNYSPTGPIKCIDQRKTDNDPAHIWHKKYMLNDRAAHDYLLRAKSDNYTKNYK